MSVTAKVTMQLDIYVPSTWGDATTMAQIIKQSKDHLQSFTGDFIVIQRRDGNGNKLEARIVGSPLVTAVHVVEQK